MENPLCIFVVEIEDDCYGRFRIALPYAQATVRANKMSESEWLSDFYHSTQCHCGWWPEEDTDSDAEFLRKNANSMPSV